MCAKDPCITVSFIMPLECVFHAFVFEPCRGGLGERNNKITKNKITSNNNNKSISLSAQKGIGLLDSVSWCHQRKRVSPRWRKLWAAPSHEGRIWGYQLSGGHIFFPYKRRWQRKGNPRGDPHCVASRNDRIAKYVLLGARWVKNWYSCLWILPILMLVPSSSQQTFLGAIV